MQADARAGGPSEMRPVREWGLDPMCFAFLPLISSHCALYPICKVNHSPLCQLLSYYTISGNWHGRQLSKFKLPPLHEGFRNP